MSQPFLRMREAFNTGWVIVNLLALAGYIAAAISSFYTMHPTNSYNQWQGGGQGQNNGQNYYENYNEYYEQQQEQQNQYYEYMQNQYNGNGDGGGGGEGNNYQWASMQQGASVGSGALTFLSAWMGILSIILGVYGFVTLGRTCGAGTGSSARLGLGIFIGSLLTYGNMLFVCGAIFAFFKVDDGFSQYNMYQQQADGNQNMNMYQQQSSPIQKISKELSALAFALSVLYTCFGLIIFFLKESLVEETELEEQLIHKERELESAITDHRPISGQRTRSSGGQETHSFGDHDEIPFDSYEKAPNEDSKREWS